MISPERWKDKFTVQPGEWVECPRENLSYSFSAGDVWDRLVIRETGESFRIQFFSGELRGNGDVLAYREDNNAWRYERVWEKDAFFKRFWDCRFALLPETPAEEK